MGRRRRDKHDALTDLEVEVLAAVWRLGRSPVTARQVCDEFNADRGTPLAYNTVQTVLGLLRDKGAVSVERGPTRALWYRARRTRGEVTSRILGELADRLFEGRVSPLLVEMVGDESLGRADLERLRALIEERLGGERDEELPS